MCLSEFLFSLSGCCDAILEKSLMTLENVSSAERRIVTVIIKYKRRRFYMILFVDCSFNGSKKYSIIQKFDSQFLRRFSDISVSKITQTILTGSDEKCIYRLKRWNCSLLSFLTTD